MSPSALFCFYRRIQIVIDNNVMITKQEKGKYEIFYPHRMKSCTREYRNYLEQNSGFCRVFLMLGDMLAQC